ncbi:DUF3533 domain-containing protein [Streptomyces albiaxialis]|uniref:DUF3533 domain-containing protein n=1 Tax=Streptomyces albiaxialis TaxID=329523 RepID=A0ABN2WFY0_9ACTN
MRYSTPDAGLRATLTPGVVALVAGVLLVQLGFLLSYIGAFHHPDPQRVPLAVAAPEKVAQRIDTLPGRPVEVTTVKDESAARTRIMDRDAQGAYVMNPKGDEDTLLVASGAGGPVTEAVKQVGKKVAADQGRRLKVEDISPSGDEDYNSLTAFYLVVGWLVGGYLVASLLGVTIGTRPARPGLAGLRLAGVAVYSVVSGLGAAIIVGPALHALDGHFMALWWIGALTVFGTAAVTMALEAFFGVIGIGIAVVIFVVLGNPSAGGAFQKQLIPPFWRAIGDWLPAGAGTTAVRNTVYFSGNALAAPMLVLSIWAVAGVVLLLIGSMRRREAGLALPI